jgi:hypothetical protein
MLAGLGLEVGSQSSSHEPAPGRHLLPLHQRSVADYVDHVNGRVQESQDRFSPSFWSLSPLHLLHFSALAKHEALQHQN